MDTTNQNTPERDSVNLMIREHHALEILELREQNERHTARIADLETDLGWMRDIATAGIHESHKAHNRERRHQERIRDLEATVRELRLSLVAAGDDYTPPDSPDRVVVQ
jgi:hypothetical protein